MERNKNSNLLDHVSSSWEEVLYLDTKVGGNFCDLKVSFNIKSGKVDIDVEGATFDSHQQSFRVESDEQIDQIINALVECKARRAMMNV